MYLGVGMGQKSRQKRLARGNPRPEAATVAPRANTSTQPQSRLKYPRLARFIASVGVPVLLLAILELALRLFGYGYSTKFFERMPDGRSLTTNQKFAWQFYSPSKATSPTPILFPKEKVPDTFRVLVLGESAAAGTPDPAFGFARMLELMLRDQYPDKRFEVVNAAMRGINSHMVRQIAAECAQLSPDLFLIYMGNNEMIGLHAPDPDEFQLSANVRWLRFQHAVKRTKLAQLGDSLLARMSKDRPVKPQDMELFRRHRLALDDPRRESVYRNFGLNLRDICDYATDAGAQALVCTVGVNLRDLPPLGSLHRRDLSADKLKEWEQLVADGVAAESRGDATNALVNYQAAARLDDHFAELLFRMARCYEVSGKIDDARRHYTLARDHDTIQFRTDSRLNNVARSIATNAGAKVHLADQEQRLAESALARHGVTGADIFQEHVHFKFDGDHLMAESLLPRVAAVLKLPAPSRPVLTREQCAQQLAYTAIDDYNVRSAIVRLTGNAPFLDQLEHAARQAAAERELQDIAQKATTEDFNKAVLIYRQAVSARPDDWMIHYNFGNLLRQMGQGPAAAAQFEQAVGKLPNQRAYRMSYGNLLLELGRAHDAAEQFEAVVRFDPNSKAAKQALAAARTRR